MSILVKWCGDCGWRTEAISAISVIPELHARTNYFFARALVGREVTAPTVECRALDAARVR